MKGARRLAPMLLMTMLVVTASLGQALRPVAAQDAGATPEAVAAADLADTDGAFIEIDGASVYYVARGPEDGPAVILLHGLLGSTLTWTPVMEALAGAGYRVIAFDQPPFGLSDKSPELDLSVAAQAERTIALLDALGIERAAVVGHSGGGPIAGTIAERYPDRVTKLVLVGPAYLGLMFTAAMGDATPGGAPIGTPGGTPVTQLPGENPGPGRQPSFALFPVLFNPMSDPGSPEDQAAIRQAIAAERSAMPPVAPGQLDPFRFTQIPGWEAGLLAHGRAWLNDPALLGPDPAAITAPVLLVWGEGDGGPIRDQLPDLLPAATVVIVPGVGHFPMEEAPAEFSRDLLNFLARE